VVLGLSITRILIEAMGGAIGYRRKDGITRFEVRLNGTPADPLPTEPDRLEEPSPTARDLPADALFWS
jgi:hypothetical protein